MATFTFVFALSHLRLNTPRPGRSSALACQPSDCPLEFVRSMIRLSVVSNFYLFRLQIWDTLQPWFAGQGRVKQSIFRAPFLAPSSWHGGKQNDSKEGCLDT